MQALKIHLSDRNVVGKNNTFCDAGLLLHTELVSPSFLLTSKVKQTVASMPYPLSHSTKPGLFYLVNGSPLLKHLSNLFRVLQSGLQCGSHFPIITKTHFSYSLSVCGL